MSTGACGIQCDVCGLNERGICSTCGPGKSPEAAAKLEAQYRLLGAPCPILACAVERALDYCSRDCNDFPCDIFTSGPFPFSQDFLSMQERRRKEPPQEKSPSGGSVEVPPDYWDELSYRNLSVICHNTGARKHPPNGILLPFLKEYLLLDLSDRTVLMQKHAMWKSSNDKLLELICLVYLLNASPSQERGDLVGPKELKGGHFFRGPHKLDVQPLLENFGSEPSLFQAAAQRIEGEKVDLTDCAYRFQVFPKIPVHLLLWEGDEEFPPGLSVLFDRSIEEHLAPDAIWGLFNLLVRRLINEAREI
jgi:hypothetical protein